MNENENKNLNAENSAPEENAAVNEAAEKKSAEEKVDEMEKESLYELEVLKEANNEENEEMVNEAEKKIKEIFDDLRNWIRHNTEPEQLKANLEDAKEQTVKVLNDAKEKAIEFSNNEDFKQAVGGIKDFMTGTGNLIGEGFQYGKEQLMKNPAIKDVFDNIDTGINKIRENPDLAKAVDKAQSISEDITSSIFSGLKSFFEGNKVPEEKKAEDVKETPAQPVKPVVTNSVKENSVEHEVVSNTVEKNK